MEKLYTISEVADKLGIATKTLRRWEEMGKFTTNRTLGGQRRYSLTDIQILDAIKHGTIPNSADLLTVEQAAALFGVTTNTVIRWENEGKIHPLITAGVTFYPRHRLIEKYDTLNQAKPQAEPVFQAPAPVLPSYVSAPVEPPSPEYRPEPPLSSHAPVDAPRPALKPLWTDTYLQSLQNKNLSGLFLLNLATTIIVIATYHLLVNRPSSLLTPNSDKGQVQGTSTARDPALTALDSILDKAGNIKSRSLAAGHLTLNPAAAPASIPGSFYFDAGSQTFKFYTDRWNDLGSGSVNESASTGSFSGRDTIVKGESELTIENEAVSQESLVIITFASDYSPAKKYWVETNQGSFTVKLDFPVSQDTGFNYLITMD